MEQDEFIYEYQMGDEIFRFEAHGPKEAQDYRPYVVLHFREKLGAKFSEANLYGTRLIKVPEGPNSLRDEGFHLQPQAWGS